MLECVLDIEEARIPVTCCVVTDSDILGFPQLRACFDADGIKLAYANTVGIVAACKFGAELLRGYRNRQGL